MSRLSGLALLCVTWCNTEDFRAWLKFNFRKYANVDLSTPEGAAAFIRYLCRIRSRRELMTNGDAIFIFNSEIREPYMRWIDQGNAARG